MRTPKLLPGESLSESFDSMLCKPSLPSRIGPEGVKVEFVGWCAGSIDPESLAALKERLNIEIELEQSGTRSFLRFPSVVWCASQVTAIGRRFQSAFNELVTGHLMAIQ